MKVTDVANPTVEEAASVDAEAKREYEKRLKARLGTLKSRRQREVDSLVEVQNAYMRSRNPSEQQQKEYNEAVDGHNFRIAVMDERIKTEGLAIPEKMHAFVSKLKADKRLMCVYDPTKYTEFLMREGRI